MCSFALCPRGLRWQVPINEKLAVKAIRNETQICNDMMNMRSSNGQMASQLDREESSGKEHQSVHQTPGLLQQYQIHIRSTSFNRFNTTFAQHLCRILTWNFRHTPSQPTTAERDQHPSHLRFTLFCTSRDGQKGQSKRRGERAEGAGERGARRAETRGIQPARDPAARLGPRKGAHEYVGLIWCRKLGQFGR